MKLSKPAELKIVDINDVRDINQTVLLHLIRERQPISRVEIGKLTGLCPGTISSCMKWPTDWTRFGRLGCEERISLSQTAAPRLPQWSC